MNSGPQHAATQPQDGLAASNQLSDFGEEPFDRLPTWRLEPDAEVRDDIPSASVGSTGEGAVGPRLLAILLFLLGLAWLGGAGWAIAQAPLPRDPVAIMNAVALVSTPLILLGIAWLILGHSPRRRTEKFARAVERMRAESQALESVLEIVAVKLEENHSRLSGEAAKLMTLGDEASDRLGRVTHYLAKERGNLDRQAEALETAAANARIDIGVLLHDLPRAEEQARGIAAAMRDAGLAAHQQAGALEGQMTALTARGREADEVVGGAAQRLGAHLARIESTAASATEKLDEATIGMAAAVDGAMARAAEAIDQTRAGLDAQGSAMVATVEHSRVAMAEAGDEAARNLDQRLQRIDIKIEGLAGQLATQDEASKVLIARLGTELMALDQQFAALRETGAVGAGQLHESFSGVRGTAQALLAELGSSDERATVLIGRVEELARNVDEVPARLERVETQAQRVQAATNGIAPNIEAIEASADGAVVKLTEAEASVGRQREAIDAMLGRLADEFATLDNRIDALGQAGTNGADRLRDAFAGVGEAARQLLGDLDGSDARAVALAGRLSELMRSVTAITEELEGPAVSTLARIEQQAEQADQATRAIVPTVSAIEASAGTTAGRLAEIEMAMARQRDTVEAMLERLGSGSAVAEEQLRALGTAAAEAETAAAKLTRDTGPELIEALLRVREAAAHAAERAREAISAAIPESAAALADASRKAVADAVTKPVEEQMAELVKVTEAAVETARHASERLTRQMLSIGEASAAVEERIDEARRDHEERESETLSRHVSLLTESLNSAAIDVTKILSNEVTDSAWTAYLKGDRGVFTRRAVRLLNSTESREILRHYEEEPYFREHVNRYIHDFEAMMRRVLADRDGSPLGVTILSSDMGKLYVALAQAIERLRR